MKQLFALFGLCLCLALHPTMLLAKDAIAISKGSLLPTPGGVMTQTIAVTNNTDRGIESITVECGFFRGDQLLVSSTGAADKVESGQRAFIEVIALRGAEDATNTECRVTTD